MRDPVAEVLAERSETGNGLAGAVVVSLLLHAGGTALAVYTAVRQPPPQPIRTLDIRFAQMPAARPAMTTPVTAPAPAAPEPVAPRIQEPTPPPVKPLETKAAEPPAKNTAPPSPFGRSTKKASEAAPPPPPPSPPQNVAATSTAGGGTLAGDIGIGEAGVTGLEGGDFPYTVYLDRMKALIGQRWLRPPVPAGVQTVIYFRIERDGRIADVATRISSGNADFDRRAVRAVLETSTLPPLPPTYRGTYLGVQLTFR